MRRIIDNRVYDTETASLVGEWAAGCDPGGLDYYEEALHRKRTGEYFVHGSGRAASRYARRDGGMWASGEAIVPMGYEEARSWAEERLPAEAYEAEFGMPEEGSTLISARVSLACKAAIDRRRSQTGETIAEIIEGLVMGGGGL